MIENDRLFVAYADGGCRGNPGPMGVGAIVYDPEGTVVRSISYSRPQGTNNQAEYLAAIAALEADHDAGARSVELRMDSELVVRQLNGEYRVKNKGLQPLYLRVQRLLRDFDHWRCVHVGRDDNVEADRLANEALDFAG
jgi:ribonuclease HI